MRKLLTAIMIFMAGSVYAQPTGYVPYTSKVQYVGAKMDSGLHVPGYSGVPRIRKNVWTGAGNVGVDTVNNKFYFYSGGAWREAGSTNYADSLRRVGLAVQMRKNGGWTTQYTDSVNAPDSFSNGLTKSGGVVKLGGELSENIVIYGNGKEVYFDSLGLLNITVRDNNGVNGIINMTADAGENKHRYSSANSNYDVGLFGNSNISMIYAVRMPNDSVYIQLNSADGIIKAKGLNTITSTTGRKVLVHDTATGKIERIDPSALGGTTPAGNYGNVQINRNGTLSTPASDSLSFSDKLNVKGNIVGTSKLILGATAAPAQSQVYVTGGVSGGNIDARGDSTSEARDEANIEVEHPDYDGISFTGNGVAMQTNGNVTTGSLLTYPKKNSGQLRFTNETNIIRVIPNRSLRFATNNIEMMVLDSNGRVGIGTKLPDSSLHIVGSFKYDHVTKGAGKVLTSDANGGASWQTPATIADTSYTTLASFTAGGGFASDTTMCTDSTLFGSFYTGQFDYTIAYIQAVIKGNAGDSIVLKLVFNDTFNVDGTKVSGAGLSVNNRYTGNTFTIGTNRVVAANTWLWLKPEAVITGKKPKYISVTLIGYKTYVAP